MISKTSVITGIRTKIKEGFAGWELDGFPMLVTEGLYPNAVIDEVGDNFPAIVLRDGGDIEFISHGGNSYYVTSEIEVFCYANSHGPSGASLSLTKIEDKIIFILETAPNVSGETVILISGINRGYRNDGDADLYSVGYYDGVSISSVTLTVNYRRCNDAT